MSLLAGGGESECSSVVPSPAVTRSTPTATGPCSVPGRYSDRRGDVERPGATSGTAPENVEGGGDGKLGREAQRLVDLMREGEGLAR